MTARTRELMAKTTLNAAEVAELLGCSTWTIYQHANALPVTPIRVGRTLRWATAPLFELLGVVASEEAA